MGRQRLYATKTERQRAWRRRKREREALNPSLNPNPVVRYADQAELRTLAAQVDRGCSHLAMDRKTWMLRNVDASRAFELLKYIRDELNRLAG